MRPVPAVVVATHVGMPRTSAKILPLVPMPKNDDVAIAVGAAVPPVPFATTVPAACVASCVSARVPEIVERVDVAVLYTRPFWSTAREPVVNEGSQKLEKRVKFEVEALSNCEVLDAKRPVRANKGVVVAAVVVPKFVWVKYGYAAARYEVVSMLKVPTPPEVLTNPFVVRFESVAMFCEVLTVKAVPEYESPVPAVVVATKVGTPETNASTWPLVPAEVVATLLVPFPKSIELAVKPVPHPVPPFVTPKIPATWVARSSVPEIVARVVVATH